MAYQANLGLIALSRFGCGPRGDGDVTIAAGDPRGYLRAEIEQPGIALLSGPLLPSTTAAADQFFADQAVRRAERERNAQTAARERQLAELGAVSPVFARLTGVDPTSGRPAAISSPASVAMNSASMSAASTSATSMGGAAATPQRPPPPDVKRAPTPEQTIFRDEALARLRRAIEARAGFAERLVAFWSNHFCVSVAKGGIARATAGAFEREAIRPHVLGSFADMLVAVESHPAMLHFLDNAQSVGPNSRAGQRGRRGLNENLGREVMELHTMGVGSGYSQGDVTNLAKILTGWTFGNGNGKRGEKGTFTFNAAMHEPGPVTLLGRTYPDEGVDQGRSALLDIARRPQTAHFIASKLARAFVSDEPPKPLVDRLATTFSDTRGDLRAVSLALIDAPEAWSRTPTKMRTPYDLIVATNRLLGHLPDEPGQVLGPLGAMGMGLWQPPGPNGYPVEAAAWASPEGMKLRLDWCAAFAGRLKDPPNPNDLLLALTGDTPSPETRDAISRAESRQQGLALLLMSPEMQRS